MKTLKLFGEKIIGWLNSLFALLYELLVGPSRTELEKTGLSEEKLEKITTPSLRFKLFITFLFGLLILAAVGAGIYSSSVSLEDLSREAKKNLERSESASARRPQITRFSPRGTVDDLDEIYISFNRPMVKKDRLNERFRDFPLEMKPDFAPRYRWTSNKQLEITTEKGIPPGTRVKFMLADTPVRDVEGRKLVRASGRDMQFIYRPLEVHDVDFRGKQKEGFDFEVEFNAPVQAADFDSHLTVEFKTGETIPYKLHNPGIEARRHLVSISHPDLFGEKIYFNIHKGLKTAKGNYPLQHSVSESYKFGELRVSYARGRSHEGKPYIEIDFNRQIESVVSMKKYITIDNDTSLDFRLAKSSYDEIKIITDYFKFGKRYKIKLAKGLSSGVFKLTETEEESVRIPDADPYLKVKNTGHFQSFHGEQVLPLEHVNTDKVHITAYDIYDNNLIFFANHYRYSTRDYHLFEKVKEAKYELSGEENKVRTSHVDLHDLFAGEMHGPKLLKIDHPHSYRTKNELIILSDLGISFKRYENEVVVLVTSLADGSPVANATVKLYSRANQVLARGRTNEHGFLRFEQVSFDRQKPTVVVAEKGRDVNYLHLGRGEVPTVGFDVDGDKYTEAGDIEAYVYGEREIYRPGSTVKLNLLARGPDLELVPNLPFNVTITGPDGEEVLNRDLRANELGIASVNYRSWNDDKTGFYTVSVNLPGESDETKQVGREQFQLEEFVPDRIETTVRPTATQVRTGDSTRFTVEGRFLFGKPAANNRLQASYTLYPRAFNPTDYPDYEFGDPRVQFKKMYQQLAEKKLSAGGTQTYTVGVPENLQPPAALELAFTGTVFDMGSRGVSGRASTVVHPYPFYIGLKSTVKNPGRVPYGKPVPFDIVTVAPGGDTVSADILVARVYREDWNYTLRRDHRGRTSYDWQKEEVLVYKQKLHPHNGRAQLNYRVSDWGDHVLEVRDPASGSRTSYSFSTGYWWKASGPGRKIDFDRSELSLAKSRYYAGETARVKLKAPFDGTAYIVLEDDDIRLLKKVKVTDRKATFSVDLERSLVPNTYLTALVLRGTESARFDAYRSLAVTPVKVIAPDRLARVDVNLPEKMTPGATEPVRIEVTTPDGQPVAGEVALSVVDQGIIQLAKEQFKQPYDYFYRKRGYFVENIDLYDYVRGEPDTEVRTKLTPSGAAMQAARKKQPFEVEQFKAISSWYPHLETTDGEVTVDYRVPRYSGQLNFRAWAVSAHRVGQGQAKKRVKEPVILRTVQPRTLSPGDTFSLPLTVMNNLARRLQGKISVQSNHFLDQAWSTRSFVLEPNGRIDRKIVMKVRNEVGIATLELSFESADHSVEKEYKIPVKPAYPRTTESQFHVLEAGADYSAPLRADFFEGLGHHKLVVSTMPDVKLLSGLDYLIHYPYGCIEQTTSSVFPQLYLKSLLKQVNPELDRAADIDENINAGIERLLAMSLPDGSFSYWPGHDETHEYGTVYAGHFFIAAKRAGYPVPETFLGKNKHYLEQLLKSHHRRDRLRAYALYVLALHGDYDNTALARKLLEEVHGYHKYYLVAALVLSGEKQAVSDYLYDKTPTTGKVERTTGGVLQSNVISKAVVLNALLEANPDLPAVDAMVADLLKKAQEDGHWGSTHDNAQALIALGKYFSRRRNEDADFTGTVTVDGEQTFTFASDRDTAFIVYGNAEKFSVTSEGQGKIHLSVISKGIPRKEKQVEVQQGMSLAHDFYNLQGEKINRRDFQQGEMYVVELRADVHAEKDNYYIQDMLPGGFEIENQHLATSNLDVPTLEEKALNPEFVDVRDDRLTVFFDVNDAAKTVRYRYLVRATTEGHFINPAMSGGCMYDPDVQAVKKLNPLRVTP